MLDVKVIFCVIKSKRFFDDFSYGLSELNDVALPGSIIAWPQMKTGGRAN